MLTIIDVNESLKDDDDSRSTSTTYWSKTQYINFASRWHLIRQD